MNKVGSFFLGFRVTHHPFQIHAVYAARQPSMINHFSIRANVLALYATFIKTGTSLHTLIQNTRSSGSSSLTTWLAHSKKKNCDVCKYPYLFTKGVLLCGYVFRISWNISLVYAPDMPSRLPPFLLIRRLVQHILLAILFVLRGIVVATIWLGVLPLVIVWTWRMYFSMGDSTCVHC